MLMISRILILAFLGFAGFAGGRIGHIYGGHLNGPHHWIYGLILVMIGIFFYRSYFGWYAVAVGAGIFVSDLKDFMDMKIYGIDDVEIKKFWQID